VKKTQLFTAASTLAVLCRQFVLQLSDMLRLLAFLVFKLLDTPLHFEEGGLCVRIGDC